MLWFDSKRLFIVLWFDFESVFTFYDLILKECKFWNIIEFMLTIFNNKGFYLLLHSIAVRTLLLSPIDLKPENLKIDKYLKQSIDIHLQANYTNVLVNESTLNIIYHQFYPY